jgi:hypothetical protein
MVNSSFKMKNIKQSFKVNLIILKRLTIKRHQGKVIKIRKSSLKTQWKLNWTQNKMILDIKKIKISKKYNKSINQR